MTIILRKPATIVKYINATIYLVTGHLRRAATGVAVAGGVERREALGPTSLGQRARKRQPLVTGDLPWRAVGPIARLRQGVSQTP